MGELTLIRHGQANSGAKTEEDYDRLSPRGHEQARLLGRWMTDHSDPFDLVIAGTMRRHRETAEGMGYTPETFDPRLNEMEYFALMRDMQALHDVAPPTSQDDFAVHMARTLTSWETREINGVEPFADFESRIADALADASEPGRRVLCITSGGVIAMVMRRALGLSIDRMAHVLLPIYNTSIHRFAIRDTGTFLTNYNAIPHLDAPDRADHRTRI